MKPTTPPVDSIPLDTTPDAHAVQREVYRRLGGRGHLDIMFGLNATVRDLWRRLSGAE